VLLSRCQDPNVYQERLDRFILDFHMGRREKETTKKRKTKGESGKGEEFQRQVSQLLIGLLQSTGR
jgi:hypothetical protein